MKLQTGLVVGFLPDDWRFQMCETEIGHWYEFSRAPG